MENLEWILSCCVGGGIIHGEDVLLSMFCLEELCK